MYLLYRGRHKGFKPNRVLYSRGCGSSICKWMRPGFRRMETARLRGNTTRDIFTCSFENINVLRKEACLYPLPLQLTVEFQRFDRLFRESSDEVK